MSVTPNFGLLYLDADVFKYVSAIAEKRNWTFLDAQLYGISSLIGTGNITGWAVSSNGNLEIAISPGTGMIGGYYGESDATEYLTVYDDAVNYIYAVAGSGIATSGDITFVVSLTEITADTHLLVATVTVTAGVMTPDNSVKATVGLGGYLADYITLHKHDGDPISKIDLSAHVTGILDSSMLGDIDASKIVGSLINAQFPQISHTGLSDIGRYTHAQVDSLLDTLQDNRYKEFGDVTAIIVAQDALAKAHLYYDPVDAGGYFRFIPNLVLVIPGITSAQSSDDTPNFSDLLDYLLTDATIDEVNHNFKSGLATTLLVPLNLSKTWNLTNWSEIVSSDAVDVGDTVTLEALSEIDEFEVTGTATFVYDTGRVSGWGMISWSLDDNGIAAPISVVTRTAATEDALASAPWSAAITESGEAILSQSNRWIEVQVTLSTDDDTVSPELDWIEVEYEVLVAGCGRMLWPLFQDWISGTLTDVQVVTDVVKLAAGGTGSYVASGVATSEVFAVASWSQWESLTWVAVQPTHTVLSVYYRSAATEGGVAVASWIGPYIEGVGGVDISAAGEFIQLKMEFATTDTGVTPMFDSCTIAYQE